MTQDNPSGRSEQPATVSLPAAGEAVPSGPRSERPRFPVAADQDDDERAEEAREKPESRDEPRRVVAAARAAQAAREEAKLALVVALVTVIPIVLLLALAATSQADWWFDGPRKESASVSASDHSSWAQSLLAMSLLLVAVQLVAWLLALEHTAATSTRKAPSWVLLWVARVLVVMAVLAAVDAGGSGPDEWWNYVATQGHWGWIPGHLGVRTWDFTVQWPDSWGGAGLVAGGAELGVLVLLGVTWRATHSARRNAEEGMAGLELPREPAVGTRWTPGQAIDRRLLAIGASGGGIRAAAFVLGGHQAIQDVERARDPGVPEPDVFAVSGGSYMAAALAMRRSFTYEHPSYGEEAGGGCPRREPVPWTESYVMGSPELERLRRHTRYLFEPAWRTRDGMVSLVMGAVVNLVILGLLLRFVVWLGAQFAMTSGLLAPVRSGKTVTGLALAPGWGVGQWVLVLALPTALLLGTVALTAVGWFSTAAFDGNSSSDDRRAAIRRMRRSSRVRPILVFAAIGWLLLVVGVPAATTGVVSMTTSNQPTTSAANLLQSAGFATEDMCKQAFVAHVAEAVKRVTSEAQVSRGEKRDEKAGACGVETSVARTADPADGSVGTVDEAAAGAFFDNARLRFQVAGIGGLLALVVGLLRRGPSPEASADAGRLDRIRRAALTWLPITIVGLVATYLTLLWTLGFATRLDERYTSIAAGLSALACVLAFLVDANSTSMHGFYRSRLSDAFAVGVDEVKGRAGELPPQRVYRFSELRGRVRVPTGHDHGEEWQPIDRARLHIVTTLNSQAANESPTMRGGFPLVFGPEHVDVHREERRRVRVPARTYEDFAGPGRVSIMAAVATSGAAISPLMGRFAVQMAPYRILLALFNLRIGAWVRNPAHAVVEPPVGGRVRDLLWMTRKPGLAQVALEAVGKSSADRRWIYLSDGGHLDNTGLVECVRHCLEHHGETGGRIVVLDASNDALGSWAAVGDAVAVVRADLGVDLRRRSTPSDPPWMRLYEGSGLQVLVVKAVRQESAADDPDQHDWFADLPPNVQSFQLVHKDFPRAPTARQKFGDLEFEAYRALGYAAAESSMRSAGWLPASPDGD